MPEEPALPIPPPPPPHPPVTLEKEAVPMGNLPGGTGLPPTLAAGLCAIFLIFGGIIFLLLERKDAFVRFWAMQSLIFGLAWFVLEIVLNVMGFVCYHLFTPLGWLWSLFSMVLGLGLFIVWIISIVQAFNGKRWEIPFIAPIVKEQLARLPPNS